MPDESDEPWLEHVPADGLAPGDGYSHVVVGEGQLVAVSGQVALDGDGNVVGKGDAAAQARQVFENLRRCLAAGGATFAEVSRFTVYVTDIAILPEVWRVRDAYVDTANPPASTAVQVSALYRPELMVQVEALALIPW
ncbi:RidA family protein [Streptomyces sp. NPDC020983]|uniref:RidA family protein n=1 Tax=Streptomyces sp. NPDC020983 TaxID=3365106 RepID=UPI0037A61CBC